MGVEIKNRVGGDGICPKKGQKVVCNYTGYLLDGTKFDSSIDRNKTFSFTIGIGQVIKGWDEGMIQLSSGETATLVCSPDYAYGQNGVPGVIPPNSILVFDVELISFS